MIPIHFVESLNEDSLKNKLMLAPFIEYFSEKGYITMQMGYQFSKELEKSMIDTSVIDIKIISNNPETLNQPVKFSWEVKEI